MPNVLSYHIYDSATKKWLAGDEESWTTSFGESASFHDSQLAQDIGERECKEDQTFYVMACLGWQ